MSQKTPGAIPDDPAADDALRTLSAALAQDAATIRSLGHARLDPADSLALGPAIARTREALAEAYADSAQRVAAIAAALPSLDPRP